jgi:hypothetical protein
MTAARRRKAVRSSSHVADAPGSIAFVASGISRAAADGLYVPRFVGGVETARATSQLDSVGATEYTLEAPNGPLQSRMEGVAVALRRPSAGARVFGGSIDRIQLGSAPGFRGIRANGTAAAPTAAPDTSVLATFAGMGYEPTNNAAVNSGEYIVVAREAMTPAGRGGLLRMTATDIGSVAPKGVFAMQGGGAAIGQLLGLQTTTKSHPLAGGSWQLRNPADTATLFEWNATGVGFYGVAPIARPNITGSRGGNAALASLLTQGALLGLWTDSTVA